MQVMTDYYLQKDNTDAKLELLRLLERQNAKAQAKLIKIFHQTMKEQFETQGRHFALHTQSAIRHVYNQVDTAIQGESGQALKQAIDQTLPGYEKIFS